jgi:predicted Rossmann fold nucleotide-binding protein DprA/Smf involved in DNA uptake
MSQQNEDWLLLALTPGIGPAGFLKLIAAFGSASHVLAASTAQTAPFVGPGSRTGAARGGRPMPRPRTHGPNKRLQPAQPAG